MEFCAYPNILGKPRDQRAHAFACLDYHHMIEFQIKSFEAEKSNVLQQLLLIRSGMSLSFLACLLSQLYSCPD